MKIGSVNTDERVFIIAEIGNNHEGDFELAKKLIGLAAQSGADAVKFQTIIPKRLVSPSDTQRIEQLTKFQFSYEQYLELKHVADEHRVQFLSTPFDLDSVRFLNQIVPAFKVASSDNTFYPLLDEIARTGKPIILSTGLCSLDDVRKTTSFVRSAWERHGVKDGQLCLLHCVCSYPTPENEAELSAIAELKKLNLDVGYSDHTLGIDAAVLSVALGARVIEKHFTIDHNYSAFRDHQLSATPEELAELVKKVRAAELLIGGGSKIVSKCEQGNVDKLRRSIVAARDISSGETLTLADVTWVRPGGGLAPGEENLVLNKKLLRDRKEGETIVQTDVAD